MAYVDSEARKEYLKQYRLKNRDRLNAYKRAWHKTNREWQLQVKKAWRDRNPEKEKARQKRNRQKHKELYTYHAAKRRATQRNATPTWADLKVIRKFYYDCPKGYEIDHIIPLQGENVCGLHVSWNLQYLLPRENKLKGNRILNG